MQGAVRSPRRGVNGAVRAAAGPHGVEGAVCCCVGVHGAVGGTLVSCRGVHGAVGGTLVSCRGVNGAVGGTRGVDWALGEGFGFGGVGLVWTLVQGGGAAESCGKAAEGHRAEQNRRKLLNLARESGSRHTLALQKQKLLPCGLHSPRPTPPGPAWPCSAWCLSGLHKVRLADGLQRSPEDEAQQGEWQRGEEEEQVKGRGDHRAQGEEGAGVLGAPALLQRRGHAGGQQLVQQPVAGEHQAPRQAIQEVQTGPGVRGGVENHLFPLLSPSFLLLSVTKSTPTCTL
ncbi:hypothetical protein EYF80_057631 [Liparis tanakae]|uniref:Uncharacterized protein n=1 Tax=Liparis tanakae TaxID=230148 RepID=A0A4Z2EUG5_9TELE|nr:hypothetical protein EYF80_057631 [Liparis tanakae]